MNHRERSRTLFRAWKLFWAFISEISRGNLRFAFKYLLFYVNITVKKLDLGQASLLNLGLSSERSIAFQSTSGPILEAVFNKLKITPTDAVIDFGSGKGGALITLTKYPFRRIAGVEISPSLVEIAQRNLAKLGIKKVAMYCLDAGIFRDFDEFNYIYMANPFPCQVMNEVMANLSASLIQVPRDLTIIYRNPTCHEIIIQTKLFNYTNIFDWRGDQIDEFVMKKDGRATTVIYKHYT